MTDFKCEECEEEFESQYICAIHHLSTKHQEYSIIRTDYKMIIKSG